METATRLTLWSGTGRWANPYPSPFAPADYPVPEEPMNISEVSTMQSVPPLRKLLGEVAVLINEHGPDSPVVQMFIDQHRNDDPEFVELCKPAKR